MNHIQIHNTFSDLPEGVSEEKRHVRLTAVLGIALGVMSQMPTAFVDQNNIRSWFYENIAAYRQRLCEINEVFYFDLDRAMEYGFCVFKIRYAFMFNTNAGMFVGNYDVKANLAATIPEIQDQQVDSSSVEKAIAFLQAN